LAVLVCTVHLGHLAQASVLVDYLDNLGLDFQDMDFLGDLDVLDHFLEPVLVLQDQDCMADDLGHLDHRQEEPDEDLVVPTEEVLLQHDLCATLDVFLVRCIPQDNQQQHNHRHQQEHNRSHNDSSSTLPNNRHKNRLPDPSSSLNNRNFAHCKLIALSQDNRSPTLRSLRVQMQLLNES
jgi:hypothetical protein